MKLRTAILTLTLGLSTVACVGGEGDDVGSSSADATAIAVDFFPWEEPVEMQLDEAASGEVAYGQCEQVEPEEGVDMAFQCGTAWSEVAWYVVPAAALTEAGGDELVVRFETAQVARGSIHAVGPDGDKKKLAVQQALLDGDTLSAPIHEGYDYYLYVARGRTLDPLWFDGTLAFTVVANTVASADTEAP